MCVCVCVCGGGGGGGGKREGVKVISYHVQHSYLLVCFLLALLTLCTCRCLDPPAALEQCRARSP